MRSGPIITRFGRAGEYYYHHRLHRCHRQNLTKNLCNLCNLWSESSSHTTSAAADWLYNRAMFTTRRWAIVLMLGAGLAVRLLIAPHGGHPYDLVVIGGWAADVAQTGYLNAYANTPANYGPLMVALMGLTARLYLAARQAHVGHLPRRRHARGGRPGHRDRKPPHRARGRRPRVLPAGPRRAPRAPLPTPQAAK